MNWCREKTLNTSLTNFKGCKNPPGIFVFRRMLLFAVLFTSFLLAIGTVSATITVTGDLQSGASWDIYVYEGTGGGSNPCSGTGAEDANVNIGGDAIGNYDDDDDYTLSWDPGSAVDVNVWFCDDGARIANFTKASVADGTTLYVDLGRVSGSTHSDLNGDYVFVCTDFNGTNLIAPGVTSIVGTPTANQFTAYFAFEDVEANKYVYVFFDNDNVDPCIWDATKTTGRRIDTTSAHAYENYGIAAEFGPETKAQGYLHNDFDYGWMRVFNSYYGDGNSDRLMVGMAKFGDLGATAATRYTLYYDSNASGKLKVQLMKNPDPANTTVIPDMNILQVAGNFTLLDANILINGDMPAELDKVNTYIGTVDYQTEDINGTPAPADYNLYVTDDAAHTLHYWDAGVEKFQYSLASAHNADDTNADIGRVSGDVHSDLSSGTAGIQIFKDSTCGTEVDNAAGDVNYIVQPISGAAADDDYNIYFHDEKRNDATDTSGQYYLHVWYKSGGTDYNTCGPDLQLSSQTATKDITIKLSGIVPYDDVLDINVDLNKDGILDLNTDDFNSEGNYFIFMPPDTDANVNVDNNVGALVLTRNKDLSTDTTFNVSRVYGNTHTALNDSGATDRVRIFSDPGCTSLVSSTGEQPLEAKDPDYNIYFESQGAADHFIEATANVGVNDYVSCIRFTNAGDGQVNEYNIDAQLSGQIPTGVDQVAVDIDQDGDYDSNTVTFSGNDPDITYYLYVTQDSDASADANFLAYDGNVLLKRNAVLNAVAETLDIARITGQLHSDLYGASDDFDVFTAFDHTSQLSSEDANVGNGYYTQYYEVPAAGTDDVILRITNVETNTYYTDINVPLVVQSGTAVGPGETDTYNLTSRLVGRAPTEIKTIWATSWGIDTNSEIPGPDTNSWNFAARVNQTDGNYQIYFSGTTDINISADEDYSQVSGVNLSFIKDISAVNHFDIDAIRGQVPWDFFGANLEIETPTMADGCGGDRIGKTNSTNGGLDTPADATYYDYQIYVDANGDDYNVLFCNVGGTLLLTRYKKSSTTGGEYHDLNVGKISGETLAELETVGDGADDISVFDTNNGSLLSSEAVQPTDDSTIQADYNVFFETTAGTVYYYLKALSDQGGTAQFTSWIKVPWVESADLNTVYNINTKLYGTYVTGVESAAVYLNGSSDWNAYSNDKPNGNEYQVYCTAGTGTDTAKFYSADDLGGNVLLNYTANMTSDNNFHVSSVTGNAHADLQETNALDNVEVYQSGIHPCTTLLSSENITIGASYTQYYKSTPGIVDANIYLKVVDRNGSYDYNTCINTGSLDVNGTSTTYNLDKKVGGYVASGLTNVSLDLGGTDGVMDTNSNIVTGTTPATYNIFSAGNADTDLNFRAQNTVELLRTAKNTTGTTLMVNVGKVSGETHANLETGGDDDVQVFSAIVSNACNTQISSEGEAPTDSAGADFTQYFEAADGAYDNTFYFIRYSAVDGQTYNTCDLNGFKTTNLEYAGANAERQVTGTVPDKDLGDPDILLVMADINASGTPNASTAPVDAGATTDYNLFLNSGEAGLGDDVNFYSDAAGTVEEFGKTLNLGSDQTIDVSLVFGETGTALEGGTDSVVVCASGLPNTYTDTTCDSYASSVTQYPGENDGVDYNIFFEQLSQTEYFLQIKDVNDFGGQTLGGSNSNFYSYHKFTSGSPGSRVDVDLNANLTGYLFEDYNVAQPIPDVNVNLMTGANPEDWNAFTFTNADGNYAVYSAGPYDLQYSKNGYITRDWTTNPGEMNDVMLATVVDTNLLNGVIVTVKDDAGNNITDATVEVVTNTNPIVVLSGCTNTSTSLCRRTGDNTAGNGASGKYYFSGFSLPQTIWVRAYKTGWEVTTSPPADDSGQTITSSSNYEITVYINDITVEAPSLNYPGDGNYLNYQTPTFTWFDVDKDEVDYNIMVDNDSDFSSPIINTDLGGGNDLDYSAAEYGSLPDGRYYWKVAAIDREGTGYWSDVRTFYIDTNNPTAPTLTATLDNKQARLTWTAGADATSGIDYYNVYARYEADPTATSTYRIVSGLESQEYTYSPQQTGTYHFGVTAVDSAGNESAISGIKNVEFDFNAPTGVTILINDGNLYTTSTTVKIDVNATGANTCQYSIDNVNWTDITCGTNTNITLGSGEGVNTVYARAIDGNQNVGTASDTIIYDATAPATAPTATATTSNNQITITWTTGADATSGIDYYKLYRKYNASGVTTSDTLVVSTSGQSYVDTPSVTGTYYYALTAVDKAGNESAIGTEDDASVDFNAPTGVLVVINDGNMYTASTILSVDFNASSANTCQYSIDNVNWTNITCNASNQSITVPSGDGVKEVYFKAIDVNQNETTASDTIILDTTAPGTAPTLSASNNNNQSLLTWTTGADATSGVQKYNVYRRLGADPTATSTYLIAAGITGLTYTDSPQQTGTWHYGVTAVDYTGNESNISGIKQVEIDLNAPTEVSIVINDGNTYTVTNSVTIDVNATGATTCQYKDEDDASWNVINCTATDTAITLPNVEGVKTVYFRAIDGNGNVTQASDTIIYDASAPETAPSSLAATTVTNQAKLTWNAGSDSVSGIAYYNVYRSTTSGFAPGSSTLIGSASGTVYTDSPGMTGTYYYVVRAVNNVGLEETNTTEVNASVDFNGPVALTVLINDGNMYTNSVNVTLDVSVSGANTCEYSIDVGQTWNAANCNAQTAVTLPAGDGDKNVCVRAIDANNNYISDCDTIVLDTTPPTTPTAVFPTSAITTIGRDFEWQWSESAGTGSPIDYYLVTLSTGATTVDTYKTTVLNSRDHSRDLNNGNTYVLTVVAFDEAGNNSGTLTFSDVNIDLNSPITAINSPTGDTNDSTPTINVTKSQTSYTCQFTVTVTDGQDFKALFNSESVGEGSNTCSWDVPVGNAMADGDQFTVDVTVTDTAGKTWGPWRLPKNYLVDTTAPTVKISYVDGTAVSPNVASTSSYTLTHTTPDINFIATDIGGSDINYAATIVDTNNITRSVTFNTSNCTETQPNKWECGFIVPAAFADGTTDNNIFIRVFDNAGNWTDANVLDINIDTTDYITMNSITAAKTTGVADDTNTNAWRWDFNITIGVGSLGEDKNKIRFKLANWTSSTTTTTIYVDGNAEMIYDANINGTKTTKIYNLKTTYDTTQTVYPLWDHNPLTSAIDANFYIQQRIPSSILSGTYSSTYGIKTYSS